MPGALPLADPAPADGLLPDSVAEGVAARDFGVYLHVPFCRVRCGYCDFNTYTATELRGVKQSDFAAQAIAELEFAHGVLSQAGVADRPASTVFFGGGTPTILPVSDLAAMLGAVRRGWGIAPGAEVTTEANPDSVDADALSALAGAGFTRVSFGVQSAVPRVVRVNRVNCPVTRSITPRKSPEIPTGQVTGVVRSPIMRSISSSSSSGSRPGRSYLLRNVITGRLRERQTSNSFSVWGSIPLALSSTITTASTADSTR